MKFTQILLFLTILLAPLYIVRFEILGVPTTLLEVLIILTIFVSVVEFLWRHRQKNFQEIGTLLFQRFERLRLGWLAILFLMAGLVSVFISSDKLGALGIFKAYFLEPISVYLLISLLMVEIVNTPRHAGRGLHDVFFTPLLFSGLWVFLFVIFQKFFRFPNFSPWEMELGRSSAVYNSANAVGLYLGPILGLAVGKLFDRRKRLIYVISSILMIIAIFFSQSTGAILGASGVLIFALIYAILENYKLIRFLKYFGYIFIFPFALHFLLLLFVFFKIDQFAPTVQNPWIRNESTATIRLCLWQGAKNLILDNPLSGAGLSGFKELYSAKYITCDAEPLEYPHNLVLNFWSEVGALGLIVFIWIIFVVLNFQGRINMTNKTYKTNFEELGVRLALIYILIHGLVDVPYFKNDLALQFWVIMGMWEPINQQIKNHPINKLKNKLETYHFSYWNSKTNRKNT